MTDALEYASGNTNRAVRKVRTERSLPAPNDAELQAAIEAAKAEGRKEGKAEGNRTSSDVRGANLLNAPETQYAMAYAGQCHSVGVSLYTWEINIGPYRWDYRWVHEGSGVSFIY